MSTNNITVRIRHPRGTDRVVLPCNATYGDLLECFAGMRNLTTPTPIYIDPGCKTPIDLQHCRYPLSAFKVSHGAMLYANLDPVPPATIEELARCRPPHIGPECTHAPSMRCHRCIEAWREECRAAVAAVDPEAYSDLDLPPEATYTFSSRGADVNMLKNAEMRKPVIRAEEPDPCLFVGIVGQAWERVQGMAQTQAGNTSAPEMIFDAYGTYNDNGSITISYLYAPPQAPAVVIGGLPVRRPDPDQQNLEEITQALGLSRVGLVATTREGRTDCSGVTASELIAQAETQIKFGRRAALVVAKLNSKNQWALQAYRASALLCKLMKAGFVQGIRTSQQVAFKSPLKLNGKDVMEAENEYFIVTAAIQRVNNALFETTFPPASLRNNDLRNLQGWLSQRRSMPAARQFADPTALLLLARVDEAAALDIATALGNGSQPTQAQINLATRVINDSAK